MEDILYKEKLHYSYYSHYCLGVHVVMMSQICSLDRETRNMYRIL